MNTSNKVSQKYTLFILNTSTGVAQVDMKTDEFASLLNNVKDCIADGEQGYVLDGELGMLITFQKLMEQYS